MTGPSTGRRILRATLAVAVLAALPFAASSGSAPRARVFPIEPRPLRKLVDEAQYIVTATVVAPAPVTPGKTLRTRDPPRVIPSEVVLQVDSVLKGKLETKTIPQSNDLGQICPAPACYELGTHVLAFLDRTEEGGYSTHALSYGAKALDDAAMKTYLERVREELAILVMTDATARRKAQVEWLVKCCEDPATRWEGAFDLAPRGDPITSMFDGIFLDGRAAGSTTPECKFDEGFARELTDPQRQRLRDAWYASKRFDRGEACLDELFLADRDPKALAWFVARLRDALKLREGDEDEDDTYDLLQRLVRRDDRPGVAALARKFDESLGSFSLHSELLPCRTYGAKKVRSYCAGVPAKEAFGKSLEELEKGWHARLDQVVLRPGLEALLRERQGEKVEFPKYVPPEQQLDARMLGDAKEWEALDAAGFAASGPGGAERKRGALTIRGPKDTGVWSEAALGTKTVGDGWLRATITPQSGSWAVKIAFGGKCQAMLLGNGAFLYNESGGVDATDAVKLGAQPVELVLRREHGRATVWIDGTQRLAGAVAGDAALPTLGVVQGEASFGKVSVRAVR